MDKGVWVLQCRMLNCNFDAIYVFKYEQMAQEKLLQLKEVAQRLGAKLNHKLTWHEI